MSDLEEIKKEMQENEEIEPAEIIEKIPLELHKDIRGLFFSTNFRLGFQKLIDAQIAEDKKTSKEIKRKVITNSDIDVKDKNDRTLLMKAPTSEDTRLCLKAGADANAMDKDGRTALMYARTAEQTRQLIAAGADVNAKDKYRRTALMYAKNEEQTKLLIAAGADVNVKDENGHTALYSASPKQAVLLANAGANIYAESNYGFTEWDTLPYASQEAIKKASAKKGIKIDNEMFKARRSLAKSLDENLGTALSEIQIPDWAKKAESAFSSAFIDSWAKLAEKSQTTDSKKDKVTAKQTTKKQKTKVTSKEGNGRS